jgi:hypothetical protein
LEDRATPAVAGFRVFGALAGELPVVTITRTDGSIFARVQAYDASFRGGVSAALGEIDGNPNTIELVTGAGPGGGPHAKVFVIDATGAITQLASFFAFDPAFTGGLTVAAGDITNDGRDDIVIGAGPGGGPHVRTFTVDGFGTVAQIPGPLGSFFAYASDFRGGVNVAAGNLDGLPGAELVTAAGPGGGPHVIAFTPNGTQIANFYAFPANFTGGVIVAPVVASGQLLLGAGPFGTFGTAQMTFVGPTTFLNPLSPFSTTPFGLDLLGAGNSSGAEVTPLAVRFNLFGASTSMFGTSIVI